MNWATLNGGNFPSALLEGKFQAIFIQKETRSWTPGLLWDLNQSTVHKDKWDLLQSLIPGSKIKCKCRKPAICYGHLLDYRFPFALYTENIWAYTFLWYNFHCQIILPAVQKNYKNSVQLHSSQFSAVSADSSSHEFSPAGEYRGPPPHYPLSH